MTVLRVALALTAAAFSIGAAKAPIIHHAIGTFTVKVSPEADFPAPAGGVATGRLGIAKTFTGGMMGTGTATMLSVGDPKPGSAGAYVAVEQFSGTVDGRKGGFVLLHRGSIDKAGKMTLDIAVAPDSGSGALTGIAGNFALEIKAGVHHYDLAYTLPQ